MGTRYVIEGGDGGECEDAGCPVGTTLIVRDLFYNTPARMKFLKKDVVEANSVAGVLDRIALSHPEVSMRFLRDGKETLHTPGKGDLKSTIYAVYGKDFTSGLLPMDYTLGGIHVTGFVSKPAASRPNRSMQHFFINGRYIKSRTAQAALEAALKGSIMVGKFPSCVLHLQMAFEAVDVNIHPAKLEVRFLNERPIFDAVYHGVKTALNQGDSPSFLKFQEDSPRGSQTSVKSSPFKTADSGEKSLSNQTKENAGTSIQQTAVRPVTMPQGWEPPTEPPRVPKVNIDIECDEEEIPRRHGPFDAPEKLEGSLQYKQQTEGDPLFLQDSGPVKRFQDHTPSLKKASEETEDLERKEEASSAQEEKTASLAAPQKEVFTPQEETVGLEIPTESAVLHTAVEKNPDRLIGEAFGTYILIERGDEMVLIDKHAAHERMLYEKLKQGGGENSSQALLAPVAVTLDKDAYAAAVEAVDLYAKAGFEIEDFGSGTILVRSVPLWLEREDVASAVAEIAGYLQSSRTDLTTERLDWLYHNVACRAAVKAGDESSPQELMALVRRLEEDPSIRYCPHGRPVSIVMKKKNLEKQFGRIQ